MPTPYFLRFPIAIFGFITTYWSKSAHIATRLLIGLLLTGSTLVAHAQPPTKAQTGLPITKLTAGIHVIKAEIADTDDTRRIGLMFRQSLPTNGGMLFVFDAPEMQCFWMRNTPLPLSIAFVTNDGTIANIADMVPYSEDAHCSAQPVRFALEMTQGWFASRGITAGKKITGLPK